mmetsp:Transcript_19286/g.76799  ORF Transcript_19286/g.76799 Transcript_19286/m.76799 type:complete len:80 (+) Transcript_19286:1005-1244(+)
MPQVPRATREVRRIDARAAYDAQYRSVDDLRRVLLRKYGDPCSLCEPFDRDAYLDRLADLEIAAPASSNHHHHHRRKYA